MKRLLLVGVAASVVGLSLTSSPASIAAGLAPPLAAQFVYQGDAFGTQVSVGMTVTSGKSAPVVLGCGTASGVHKTNTLAGIDAGVALHTGAINTTADTESSPVRSRTSAAAHNVSALDGLITAGVVQSVSSTSHLRTGFSTSSAGTSFTSLVVAGVPVVGVVDPNTRVDLAGFGYVILNEQTGSVHGRSASLTVNAVHVVVTESNALGVAVGTNVIIAHARSGVGGPAAATLDGFAYGSKAKGGDVFTSGPSFRVVLSCLGTNGRLKSNGGAGVSLPGVLETGDVQNTAEGTVTAASSTGETTSTVDNADVVDGLVQATVIRADAHATSDGTSSTFSDAGSSFATLSVPGFPDIGPNTPPNTKVHLAGLGTLWIHRVIHRPDSIEVRMIELVVKQANDLGLPVGADLEVAVAHASVH